MLGSQIWFRVTLNLEDSGRVAGSSAIEQKGLDLLANRSESSFSVDHPNLPGYAPEETQLPEATPITPSKDSTS